MPNLHQHSDTPLRTQQIKHVADRDNFSVLEEIESNQRPSKNMSLDNHRSAIPRMPMELWWLERL